MNVENNRIFGRVLATELSAEDLLLVAGGGYMPAPGESCTNTSTCVVDDFEAQVCRIATDDCA